MKIRACILLASALLWCGCSLRQTCCTCATYCESPAATTSGPGVTAPSPIPPTQSPSDIQEAAPVVDPPMVEPVPEAPTPPATVAPATVEPARIDPAPMPPSPPAAAETGSSPNRPERRATRKPLIPLQFPRVSFDIEGVTSRGTLAEGCGDSCRCCPANRRLFAEPKATIWDTMPGLLCSPIPGLASRMLVCPAESPSPGFAPPELGASP